MDHIHTAVSMFHGATIMHQEFDRHPEGSENERARRRSLVIPLVVAYVFGIEVGIKALIRGQGGNPRRDHDLAKLFEDLEPEIQRQINERVTGMVPRVTDVRSLLEEHRRHFETWRYLVDHPGPQLVHLGPIRVVLQTVIDVHTEKYGNQVGRLTRESASETPSSMPKSIRDKALQYRKNVYGF